MILEEKESYVLMVAYLSSVFHDELHSWQNASVVFQVHR